VFMLGWEFPPFISGGLGTACYGLTKALDQLGVHVTFVLPKMVENTYATHVKLLGPNSRTASPAVATTELKNVKFRMIDSPLEPYATPESYQQQIEETIRRKRVIHGTAGAAPELHKGSDYSNDMYHEVHRYAALAVDLARSEQFDVVHAHDWMTYPAGIAVASITGRPLIVHVHSTEFDRSGEHVNQAIYDIERQGMHRADKVIAVSHFTRSIVISRYGVSGDKVEVVHNGVDRNGNGDWGLSDAGIQNDEKIVLFLGRITMQKGPEYFLYAAKKVLDVMDNVKFVMAGSGDMMHRTVELAAELGIGHKVLFTGFLRGQDVQKIYNNAFRLGAFRYRTARGTRQRCSRNHQQAERRLRSPYARPESQLLGRRRNCQQDCSSPEVPALADDFETARQFRGQKAAVEGYRPQMRQDLPRDACCGLTKLYDRS